MQRLIVASVLTIGLASPALAAEKYSLTVDMVGNCSIVQSLPDTGIAPARRPSAIRTATRRWRQRISGRDPQR